MNTFVDIYVEILDDGICPGVYELIDKVFEIKTEKYKCVNAFLIGENVKEFAKDIYQYGLDNVWFLEIEGIDKEMEDIYISALTEWLIKTSPEALLCCSSVHSKSIMPRIAVRLMTGLCADCFDIKVNEVGNMIFVRTAYSENLIADIMIPDVSPQMATIKASALKAKRNTNISKGKIQNFGNCFRGKRVSKYIISNIGNNLSNLRTLESAQIVIVVGMGIGKKENLRLIYKLISLMDGAELGATRSVVEKGWIDSTRQVGQTGVILNAKLCILCGVSGSIQHVIGLRKCKTLIAINTDKDAPIFQVANYGIIGDLLTVLPEIIEQVKCQLKRFGE